MEKVGQNVSRRKAGVREEMSKEKQRLLTGRMRLSDIITMKLELQEKR